MLAAALVSVALFAAAPMQEPTVGTGAATDITSTSVTVSGEVDGFGELTRYWFQFGTSTGYGGGTEAFTTTDAFTVAVTATLSG
ncbi:MAG TPA: hypothetical protein VGX45_06245, partial [Solirubrobacteraceae bacterium]|nr:hypothetical protein [Solirubrobacteraceae bacterium]